MKLKIYQPTYETLGKLVRVDSDYELVFDGEMDTVDLSDVFRTFTGRMPPYMYLGRSLGEGDVICVFGGRWHGSWICESDNTRRLSFRRVEFDEESATDPLEYIVTWRQIREEGENHEMQKPEGSEAGT